MNDLLKIHYEQAKSADMTMHDLIWNWQNAPCSHCGSLPYDQWSERIKQPRPRWHEFFRPTYYRDTQEKQELVRRLLSDPASLENFLFGHIRWCFPTDTQESDILVGRQK
jgi:hypothetical protein